MCLCPYRNGLPNLRVRQFLRECLGEMQTARHDAIGRQGGKGERDGQRAACAVHRQVERGVREGDAGTGAVPGVA